jgi:hypothetical protein
MIDNILTEAELINVEELENRVAPSGSLPIDEL